MRRSAGAAFASCSMNGAATLWITVPQQSASMKEKSWSHDLDTHGVSDELTFA